MRVADYIFRYLADFGVKDVFLVVGGGAMYLNDALNNEKRINYICNHHEQASAIAAEGYARTSGKLAVVSVTSGPGGTNALTGVIGQWLDSVPVLYLSGQVKYETTIASCPDHGLRQLGDQEINIVDIVKPVTKYAAMVIDPKTIRRELEKAIHLATSGRPGPVWLDIPLNVQGAQIDERKLAAYKVKERSKVADKKATAEAFKILRQAKRPVIVAGHGVRLAGAERRFLDLVKKLKVPVVTTFNGFDLLPSDSKYFIGRIGTLGSRGGNYALQNADVVLCLGTRNNIRQVSYNWDSFTRQAVRIIVDIDPGELCKHTVKGDISVLADAGAFIQRMIGAFPKGLERKEWLHWCLERKQKYPIVLPEYKEEQKDHIHPYYFLEQLTARLGEKAICVAGNGTACVGLFQAGVVKSGQRMFWNSGCAAMGYDLPAAIGAAVASGRDVICLAGDGSLQMNLQELQTVKHHRLPVKLFVLNNHGYRSIEQTQSAFFEADFIGCNEDSGVSFPDNKKLAALYEMPYYLIDSVKAMNKVLPKILAACGPLICEVEIGNEYVFSPKLSSERLADGRLVSKPLEDLHPFLDRNEHASNLIDKGLCQ